MKLKIAVVQFNTILHEPQKNIKKAEKFIKEASRKKTDIIIFPENFLTGPIQKRTNLILKEKKYSQIFQVLAKEYKIDLVLGSIIEKHKTGNYNVSNYIDAKGKIKSSYKKINLWHTEKNQLTAGNEIKVFNTKYGKIGIIICWDLAFPEILRRMVKKGVKIIFCPSYWLTTDSGKIGLKYSKNAEANFVDSLVKARAIENEIIFVYCNSAGKLLHKQKNLPLLGHSQIAIPFKGTIKKLEHNKEEMFIQEVNTEILKDAERSYRIRKTLKEGIL